MPEQQIEIQGIDNVKTKTAIRKIMDKGEEIDRELVTMVSFEGEIEPTELAQIHRLLKAGHTVNVIFRSPQLVMAGLEVK